LQWLSWLKTYGPRGGLGRGRGLPAGSVTLYETSPAGPLFAGEAQLNIVPPGQKRLIAFGKDQKVRVDRELKRRA